MTHFQMVNDKKGIFESFIYQKRRTKPKLPHQLIYPNFLGKMFKFMIGAYDSFMQKTNKTNQFSLYQNFSYFFFWSCNFTSCFSHHFFTLEETISQFFSVKSQKLKIDTE